MKNVKVGTDAMVVLDKNYYYFKSFEIDLKTKTPAFTKIKKQTKSKEDF